MSEIAQLIKLIDYVTRYEWDTFRYPSQYIRIKKDNWNKLYHLWLTPLEAEEEEITLPTEKRSKFARWKGKFIKNSEPQEVVRETTNELPETEAALKQYFLDRLLNFQFKWATSTVTDQSMMNNRYQSDPTLKYFLQRFPDTFLLMYYPVFSIKKTPIDAEIIFISPIGIEIIYIIEEPPSSVIMADGGRTWTVETNHQQTKMLSPLIALKRTEQIVKSILASHEINFSVQKTVLSRTNPIVFSTAPYNTKIIDKNAYKNWFLAKRKLASPLKSIQLKAAEALLQHCETTSVKRAEWEEDANPFKIVGEES
ncbi:hypothetical protein JOC34_000006 [Virgibacillus halotolerans]|nr:hypothetical protein [Virgibacillus halotolerans]